MQSMANYQSDYCNLSKNLELRSRSVSADYCHTHKSALIEKDETGYNI